MPKKIISLILTLLVLFVAFYIPASAYEPTSFELDAKVALLASLDTDEVLYSKDADKKVYPASITKIMTAIVILESEKYNPDEKIAMTKEVLKKMLGTGSVVSPFEAGEEITHLDLLYTVLMSSYGDCTYLAADKFGGTEDGTLEENVAAFVEMMNKKAQLLGMKNTHYANPVGLHDEENYTTANDTLILAKYALQNKTFRKICETTKHTFNTSLRKKTIGTTVSLQDPNTSYYYPYAKGIKTGFTDEAGRCLVSTASYNDYNYVCIVFGCPNDGGKHFIDSKNLYRWAFTEFEFKTVADGETPIHEIKVTLSSDSDFVPLYTEKSLVSVLPKKADDSTIEIIPKPFKDTVKAPIKKGDVLGTADIVYANNVIGTVNLVAGEDVRLNYFYAFMDSLKNFFTSKAMLILYILAALAIIAFIISVIRLNVGRGKKRKVKYIPYNENEEKNNEDY